MKKFTIQLTNDQVQKAIKLCLDNARSFLDDAELSIKNNHYEIVQRMILYLLYYGNS